MKRIASVVGLAAASLGLAGMFEPLHDMGGTPPGQGKKNRIPKPARPTTQPDGESRQVRRARERAEAKHHYGKDWRSYVREGERP